MPQTVKRAASEVYLRFGFHESMENASWLPTEGHWCSEKGKLSFITSDNITSSVVDSNRSFTSSQAPVPNTLAIGDALSATATCTKFQQYTRAQIVPFVNAENIKQIWEETIEFVAQRIFNSKFASFFAVSARVVTLGCFVERVTSSQFSVGIITQTHDTEVPHSVSGAEVALWCGACFGGQSDQVLRNAQVPICQGHRNATMNVRAEAGAQQIHAGELMPPIHVVCRKSLNSHSSRCTIAGSAFSRVKLFLIRPNDGVLQGITMFQLNGEPNPPHRTDCNSFHPLAMDVPHLPSTSANHQLQHIVFQHVAVSVAGETLIGVECCIKDAYRPFVAPLMQVIPPFLVVPAS